MLMIVTSIVLMMTMIIMIIMLVILMMMSITLMLDDYQMLPWLLILTLNSSFGATTKAGYFFRSGSRTNLKKGATIDSGKGNWLVFHFLTSSSAPSVANFLQ